MHSVSAEDSKSSKRRGPVSCAECRRLKLKCDRRLPCTSCSKRGCAAICPNGTLAAGPGNRFVLADTQHLHDKIDSMAKRIAELEDGLASLVPPGEVHPLLADDLLRIKALPNTENVTAAIQQQQEGGTDGTGLAEFFGTLKIGDRPQFFGPTAAADYLTERPRQPTPDSSLPLDLLLLSSSFPLAQLHDARADIQRRLGEWLPRRSEARALLDTYYADGDWMFRVIPRDELERTIFDRVYAGGFSPEADVAAVDDAGHASSPESNMSHQSPSEFADSTAVTAHELAVLFMILAHGYHFDTARPPYNSEGHISYQLARVALGLDPVDEHPTLSAIRALHSMSTFVQFTDAPNSGTVCYVLIGLATQLARSLGMHRDDSRWNLDPAEQQARRNIFWDVVTFEYWCALSFGRPSSWSPSQVDAKLPEDVDRIVTEDGVGQVSFRLWAMSFTQTRMMKVMDQAFGITPLTYATVMRLDKYIKEQPVSDFVRLVHIGRDETTTYTKSQVLQRHLCFCMTHKLLLYLHRAYLAQAIIECPDDPLKSRYAGSVLSAYRSAIYISASVRALRLQVPLCIKTWAFWTYAYSSFVVLCSIVIRSTQCGLAPPAFKELELLHAVFDSVRTVSRRVDGLMPTMTSMLQKARAAYAHYEAAGAIRMPCTEIEAMGLGFLWGHTRTIEQAPDGSVLNVTGSSPFTKMTPMTNEVTPAGQSFYDGINGGGPPFKGACAGSTSGSSACGSMSPPSLTAPVPSPPTQQANLSTPSPRGGGAGSGKLRTQRSMDLDPQQQQQKQHQQQPLLRTPTSMDFEQTPTVPAPAQQPYLRTQPSHEFNQPLLRPQPSIEFDQLMHSHPSMDSRHSSPGMQPPNVILDAPSAALLPSGGGHFGGVFDFQNPTWFQQGQPAENSHTHADPYGYPLQPANQPQTSPYSHPSVQIQPPAPTSDWRTQPTQSSQQQQQYNPYIDPGQQRQQHYTSQLHPHHQQQQSSKRYYDGSGGQQGQNQPPPLPAALDTTWDRFVEDFASPGGMYTGAVPHS